jgi:beta-glucosidase
MRVRLVATLAASAALIVSATAQGDGRPVYKDPRAPVERRVADLLGRMTLEQKVGQMGQINVYILQGDPGNDWDRGPLNQAQLDKVLNQNMIGSILSGGGAWPPDGNDGNAWAREVNAIQQAALAAPSNTLGIPIIYGVDAVHGHNNLSDATQFPHQIGLGATFDPGLVHQLGVGTGRAVRATGIAWSFSPVLDTERDIRWGRSYEPFGEDPFLNGVLGAASIAGQQRSVAATAKHFVGYSAPDTGHDRTDATISQAELQDIHLPPFQAGIDAGVQTVMVNSGSVNGEPVHASHRLLTDVLRGQLGFKGVVISDWQDVENLITKYHVASNMEDALALAVNAGMDMSMIPLDATGFTTGLLAAVHDGKVSQARIDQAVSRILALKFRQGLFEHPFTDAGRANAGVEDPADRPLARRAAQESLVLLENRGALPLRGRAKVLVTGPNSDSAVNQPGGWTIGWQGAFGLPDPPLGVLPPEVTTVREGLQQAGLNVVWKQGAPVADTTDRNATPDPLNDAGNPAVVAARDDAVAAAKGVDAVVVAVGESPYAEGQGDDETPELTSAQAALVDALEATGKPVIVVVIAGRPLVMNAALDKSAAALMAFLPGSEGGAAIADALTGRVNPSGRLTVSWPKALGQFPLAYNEAGAPYDPRYPFGYGLSYTRFDVKGLDARTRWGRVDASAFVRNVGRRDGGDTVLAFAERLGGGAPKRLVAFDRVGVRAGGLERAKLSFDVSRLASTQPDGRRSVLPGTYKLTVEGASTTFRVG